MDTKRTIIIWFLFPKRYFGTFLKSTDVYSAILLAVSTREDRDFFLYIFFNIVKLVCS